MLLSLRMKQLLRLFILLLAFSCATDQRRYGRVETYGDNDRSSFLFTVSDEFVAGHKDSLPDKTNPKITTAESSLLVALLKEKEFCLNQDGAPTFTILSRQEKIFDATFAHLIENNYRARPLTPRTYAGKCRVGKDG